MHDLSPITIGEALNRRVLFAGSSAEPELEVGFVHDRRGQIAVTLFDGGDEVETRTFQIVEVHP